MSDDKVDMPLSKGGDKGLGDDLKLGDMRAHKDRKKNEVHVHDDGNKMVFRQANIIQFDLAVQAFRSSGPRYKEGTTVLFPGLTSDPGGGRKACDLLLTRTKTKWTSKLVECGTFTPDVVQIVDPVIYDLYEAVYGSTSKIGNLKFNRDIKGNEIKVTSESASISFIMEGIRRFDLAIDGFLSTIGQYRGTASVLMPGDGFKKDENCDLVLQMIYGHWSAGLFFKDGFQADVVIGDEVLNDLDEIAQL